MTECRVDGPDLDSIIDVTYSYWDGSGHRRTLSVPQGTTIDRFLDQVRQEFKELRSVNVENLLFIKEDLIIPHVRVHSATVPQCHRWMVAHWRIASGGCGTMQHYSFYDLIVTKARGKSGPLFNWDVHDDVRVLSDARKEKDEVRGIYPPWLCAACDCEADVEPPWRCRSRTLPRSWSDDGMSATSTSSRPVDGRSSTRQSSAIDTRSTVIEQAVVDSVGALKHFGAVKDHSNTSYQPLLSNVVDTKQLIQFENSPTATNRTELRCLSQDLLAMTQLRDAQVSQVLLSET